MEKKKLNKTTKSNLITYGMVLAAYLIVQGMIAGNLLSNLMQGLLVPLITKGDDRIYTSEADTTDKI